MAAINFTTQDEYKTPKEIIDLFGPFDYDPATTSEIAKHHGIPHYDTIETNGLEADWSPYRKIWINPPFSKKFEFLKSGQKQQRCLYFTSYLCTNHTKICNHSNVWLYSISSGRKNKIF